MTTSSKPRRKRELAAKLVFDDSLLGDVGFLSEDLWADIFGALPVKREVGEEVDEQEEEEVSTEDPVKSLAISLTMSPSKSWTIVPIMLPPESSQFQRIPPSTLLFPWNPSTTAFLANLRSEISQLTSSKEKGTEITICSVSPVDLKRVVVEVSPRAWRGEQTETLVRRGLSGVRIVHNGDKLLGGVAGEVLSCEPVGQGKVVDSTNVVVLRGEFTRVSALDESDEEDEEEDIGVTSFFNLPPRPGHLGVPTMSSTPSIRNGSASPSGSVDERDGGRRFRPHPLAAKIEPDLLYPRPRENLDDEEARVYVEVGELVKLGKFSGDWVGIAPVPDPDALADRLRAQMEVSRRRLNGGKQVQIQVPQTGRGKDWRPVRVYSLPEIYTPPKKTKGDIGRVYMSPILLANLLPGVQTPTNSRLTIFSLTNIAPSRIQPNPQPPAAKEVTLSRIASPISTDRALQPSLLLGLKSYFEANKRLVKRGDLIAVTTDEFLARSLYGEEHGGVGEDLLVGGGDATFGSGKAGRVVAWFRVGNISSGNDETSTSEKNEEDPWGGLNFVDPTSTRMVQAGSEKRKIPPALESPWQSYLGLAAKPMSSLHNNMPLPLVLPSAYTPPILRKLRELMATSTSPRAIHLGLPPVAVLLTSTQRSIGKKSLALKAAADVGVHIFHIDAYDILADGGNGDVKTEAFLRARVDRALACGKDHCVLLVTHVEAFSGAGKLADVLKELVEGLRMVIMTTTEVDKLSDDLRNVFTHELEVGAPDEHEREGLLRNIVEEKGVPLGNGVSLKTFALKTAALVAGDLSDVVTRAITVSNNRTKALAKEIGGSVTIKDLEMAGGEEIGKLMPSDFEIAVEEARKNFSDSIGAPKIPNVKWDDVGGMSHVKSAINETIQLPLERPELFAKGMKKRSGILFYGPPGTGKTLLAKAIATEFSLNFFSVKGPELLNMYIGESEANVRRVFQRARDARPCVVFFDELDSVAPKRGNQGDSGGVMDRIVSQLLAELDGMSEGKGAAGGVFVVGATNRPDLLDPALLRPGRFDKLIYLGISDTHEKQHHILQALTRKFTLSPRLDLMKVAQSLPFTYTGADLYALCSDAMLKAITRQAQAVDAKVKATEERLGRKVGMAWWWDHESVESDKKVVVEAQDFAAARAELVGSVSQKELEHYERVRADFETVEKEADAKKKKKKGKEKAAIMPPPPAEPVQEQQPVQLVAQFGDSGDGEGEDLYGAE
ncbi:AAA-domain-containing protein [Ascobolus immersus RN42]|uniref:Peroxisomal ATPase PEX6 n=1 Tax=Ascobolus immersus RN42 TaxID=1160509 RepID=A0A3N4IM35_ASCIM|nr:AAA-domain-containing protein [Ascobolus immersus RN42]